MEDKKFKEFHRNRMLSQEVMVVTNEFLKLCEKHKIQQNRIDMIIRLINETFY